MKDNFSETPSSSSETENLRSLKMFEKWKSTVDKISFIEKIRHKISYIAWRQHKRLVTLYSKKTLRGMKRDPEFIKKDFKVGVLSPVALKLLRNCVERSPTVSRNNNDLIPGYSFDKYDYMLDREWRDSFRFLDLAVKGVPALGHRDFPEINLRFYVMREVDGEMRRGVVFLREVTPRRIVEWVARSVYNEPYETLPMRSAVSAARTEYELHQSNEWQGIAAEPSSDWQEPEAMEEFFIEHYWGYNTQADGRTMEYEVTHPKWQTRSVDLTRFDLDLKSLYDAEWAEALAGQPDSIVLADGSEVTVFSGARI